MQAYPLAVLLFALIRWASGLEDSLGLVPGPGSVPRREQERSLES